MHSNILIRLAAVGVLLLTGLAASRGETARETISQAILAEDGDEQIRLVATLLGNPDPAIGGLLKAWQDEAIYVYSLPKSAAEDAPTEQVAIMLTGPGDAAGKQAAVRVDTGRPLTNFKGEPVRLAKADLTAAETFTKLKSTMRLVLNVPALNNPDASIRRRAASDLGKEQNESYLAPLQARVAVERNARVLAALREAIALTNLASKDPATLATAARELGQMGSIPSKDALTAVLQEAAPGSPVAIAATKALADIQAHIGWVNFDGMLFRGASAGSILLIAAIGLAITFGLMGVINMAHGEFIAIGAYTTYFVQTIFGSGLTLSPFGHQVTVPGLGLSGAAYDSYFIFALPISFLAAALVGIALERSVIRFLYRRPLESLLATWGVSLLLQQLFRLIIGPNNVQVDSPAWLSSNWTFYDVQFGWNRVFVIGFSIAIIFGIWLLLTRTPLGLLIRAVMQNRQMAACMGVRTQRVNMLTFGLGSGLAGLAGAFFSQLGNVGPNMGQSNIVASFMTVVVGGVGSMPGTVVSALGIGVANESTKQVLGDEVFGKIIVLCVIILFLQWRPAGLFVTKSRSLEG
jgi:urea transport system permease protein